MDITLLILTIMNAILLISVVLVLLVKKPNQDHLKKSDLTMVTDFLDKTLQMNQTYTQQNLEAFRQQLTQSISVSQEAANHLRLEMGKQLDTVRETLIASLDRLQKDNGEKLDKMRETVDEKLNKTLEERLTQKFQLISAQFETVQKGFGEMQGLVSGVDELKRALSNVKTRGIMGEIQLGRILEEILSPDMYLKEVSTRPGSHDRVEFAIKLPGDGQRSIFLPIDSKFPLEDYYAVLAAYDTNDLKQVDAALKVLEGKIERFASDIEAKYIEVPYTTNFAVLFLPIEGLYAEAIRRGLVEKLQTKYKVVLAGPTTMSALLNSLQIGFKTLAIQKKSQEVWQVLSNARNEFDKFADVLAKTQEKIQSAGNELDKLIGTRTRMIQSKLKNLDQLGEQLAIPTENEEPEE
jgi:DNA recombination protein RmuC